MKPKDGIIFADMDGTLLTNWDLGPVIVEDNLLAIRKWLAAGGYFSVATGRNLKNVPHFFTDFKLNIPFVLVNGALLYLPSEERIIYQEQIPKGFLDEAIDYFNNHHYVSLVLSDQYEVYSIIHQKSLFKPIIDFPNQPISVDQISELEVLKVSFVIMENYAEKVNDELQQFTSIKDVNILPSSSRFIEVVSNKANKAEGITRALNYANLERKIICIGDYLNDLEMADIADYFAAPENAHPEVKKRADFITLSNNEGAIASLISKLMD